MRIASDQDFEYSGSADLEELLPYIADYIRTVLAAFGENRSVKLKVMIDSEEAA